MDYPADGVTPASSAPAPTPPPSQAAPKILSRNSNGTLVLTSAPSNEAELQLYRVMQRASLLAYYDTLLEMGGDDVQQLCDAGEEEFLEIMALVGMASKPLHVRRLQKALQEWLTNPAMFQTPLLPGGFSTRVVPSGPPCVPPLSSPGTAPLRPDTVPTTTICPQSPSPNATQGLSEVPTSAGSPGRGPASSTSPGPSPGSPLQLTPVLVPSQISRLADAAQNLIHSLPHLEPKANNTKRKACKDLETVLSMAEDDPLRMDQIRKFAAIYGRFDCKRKPEKPLTLHEVSVNEAAAQICRLVPALLTRRDELFPLARQVVRDSGYHYSKGHSKSYSVSQGARSLYSNGDHGAKRLRLDLNDDQLKHRRQERLEQIAEELRGVSERTEELLGSAVREPGDLPAFHFQLEALQARQAQLLMEQGDLVKQNQQSHSSLYYRRSSSCGQVSSSFDSERLDTDDTDSQLSFSNASSPSQEVGDSRDSLTREADTADPTSPNKPKQSEYDDDNQMIVPSKPETDEFDDPYYQENKVQVIASSGGNIIAVANPALSMSPAITDSVLLKKESLSPKLST